MHLHLYNYARFALCNLLEYVKNQQSLLVEKLQIPILFESNTYLYLGNRALEQLNVIGASKNNLFDLINYTETQMGKRFLYNSLTNPLINKKDIDTRLNLVETIINNNIYDNIKMYLSEISDLSRLIRRLENMENHKKQLKN